MKKFLALMLIGLMIFTLAACGSPADEDKDVTADSSAAGETADDQKDDATKDDATADNDAAATVKDVDAITDAGKLVVGVTVYEPMNYKDADGKWTGFDTEFAEAVAKKLGVEAEFVIIDWDNKWATLNSKKIDAVWNGMTLSDEAMTNASCTDPYVLNAQVVVMKSAKVADYATAESMADLNFAVEAGSAGKDIAVDQKFNYKEYAAQSDAMAAVKAGKADACIIDITVAKAMTGEGTDFADLGIGISLTEEEYAIACRKGSDLTEKINTLMDELKDDGTLGALAKKYNVNLAD
ncbi:MAG: transporter substrate-binding domain-containing protein [Clostridia bacterium]|nr:transporter substrate-binding domain-containing protein [Clostridia bacterium]